MAEWLLRFREPCCTSTPHLHCRAPGLTVLCLDAGLPRSADFCGKWRVGMAGKLCNGRHEPCWFAKCAALGTCPSEGSLTSPPPQYPHEPDMGG